MHPPSPPQVLQLQTVLQGKLASEAQESSLTGVRRLRTEGWWWGICKSSRNPTVNLHLHPRIRPGGKWL